jgi:branched-chain amino acid aminotransferase
MGLPQNNGFIWMDGEFVPAEDAKVHIMTHTLHYGSGVFEGVRAYLTPKGTAIFRLHAHTDRLFRSAKILNMEIPYTKDQLNQAQIDTLKKNHLKEAYLRPIVYYDHSSLGLRIKPESRVRVAIAVWEWGAYLGEEQVKHGIRAKFSSISRHFVNAAFTKAKSNGQYINCTQASMEASLAGYDEALMMDCEGYLSEASSANVFIIRDGQIITPPTDNCLEGITRDAVIHLAKDAGYEVIQRRITRDEVYIADEAFLTGTAVEITPIREVDNRSLSGGKPGPITLKLKKIFEDQVHGKRSEYPEWLVLI